MIQRYFDKIDRGTGGKKQVMEQQPEEIAERQGKVPRMMVHKNLSSHYLVSKYERMKENGELERFERKIQERLLME